jgi:putative PIN family toxin of toxin-antitoxin system
MLQVVLDTNVVAAAMLSKRGASHQLLRLVGDPRWRLNLSVPLVLEYEQTLKRVCADGAVGLGGVEDVLAYLCGTARLRPIFFLWRPLLPDPGDHMVLELAVESRADFIVTFNGRDFRPAVQFGIQVVTPAGFLAILEREV